MSNVVVLDAGNSIIKAKNSSREVEFPHALKQLSETEYRQIVSRSGEPHADYVRVNGIPYVVGERAERHGLIAGTRQTGAARYTENYYGIFVAAVLARIYEKSMKNVTLFGSHAPGDIDYRDDLMAAAAKDWTVEYKGKEYKFNVSEANTFEEPLGGLMNVILTADGTRYQRADVNTGTTLVIDIGGHTTDGMVVDPGGNVDYSTIRSEPMGILRVLDEFQRILLANNRLLFKKMNSFRPDRVRDAIRCGEFDAGGKGLLDCRAEADEACYLLINQIADFYQTYGGPTHYHYILLTGGGSALLYHRLLPILDHQSVLLAEDSQYAHLANVRGGMKLFRFFEAQGWV